MKDYTKGKAGNASADLTKGARIDFGDSQIKLPKKYKITQEHFEKKCARFDIVEPRFGFYDKARNLMFYGFKTEARLLLLATWNSSAFRYVVNEFDIRKFEDLMHSLEPTIEKLRVKEFRKADFKSLEKEVSTIYNPLSKVEGIGYTGASKLMHLDNPRLFVPWDQFIREKFDLEKDSDSYVSFLEKMQSKFNHLKDPEDKTKSFAKAIDEYNYVTISIPKVAKIRKIEEARKEKKRKELEEFREYKKKKNL